MPVRTDEQRRNSRMPAAHPVQICDSRGRFFARGRTTNISETGVFLIIENRGPLPRGEVMLAITVPASPSTQGRRGPMRTVHYSGRIVRKQTLGQLMGLGIEFLRKLG